MDHDKYLPLTGLRVVEMGTIAALPRSARVLAGFGADVIKVEAPQGDSYRVLKTYKNQYDTMFTAENSNKRFVSIDLKHPAGKEAFLKLLETTDVFMTNVRMKALCKLGIDYENLKERFPRLIYTHFSGYGTLGPEKDAPGYDTAAFWAKSGSLVDIVKKGNDPVRPSVGFGDLATSNALVAGTMIAVYAREHTGHGTFVSSSLYNSAIWCASNAVITSQFGTEYPDDFERPANPFCRTYECKDGEWINFTFSDYDGRWEANCRLFGLEDYISDERYNTAAHLVEGDHKYELTQLIKAAIKKKTQAEWLEILQTTDAVYSPVRHFKDIAHDEQAWANDFLEMVPFEKPGPVAMPLPPMHFSEYGRKKYEFCGPVGAHTREVLREVGMTDEQVDVLAKSGAVITGESIDAVRWTPIDIIL
jgi:crotonobetainyl-CoA:carnitine CoA-transferase CaiB-like acyl-CoA transferase